MNRMFDRCPACGGRLVVTECRCTNCAMQLRSEFSLGLFSTLPEDQLSFISLFLRARGNLSEVEKVLGVSYPTIRSKLDEINKALDRAEALAPAEADQDNSSTMAAEEARRAILQQVADGKLPAIEAVEQLRHLHGGD